MIEKYDETYCDYGIFIGGLVIPGIIYTLLMKPEYFLKNVYILLLGMIVGALIGFVVAGYISINVKKPKIEVIKND